MMNGKKSSRFEVSQVSDGVSSEPTLQEYQQQIDESYVVSLRNLTCEALPRIDLYRNEDSLARAVRPTLDELHYGSRARKASMLPPLPKMFSSGNQVHQKFGWIQGVLILNIMNLWGPMLFLRTSWLVGQGGIIEGVLVILFSAIITTITALSTSAIATNGEVKGGGTYYMLSRSLGPEYGGAIGLIFAFANMVGVAMNIVGFCESLLNLLKLFNIQIIDGGVNDTRVIGTCVVIVCTIICLIGMEWVNKLQTILLITLLTAITDVIVGSFLPVTKTQTALGITGWSASTAYSNLMPDYRGETFATIFAVYFPSATGILAGANVSGELKDPQRAIPKGTLWAIFMTTTSYLMFAIISGFCVIRDASGNVDDVLTGNYTNCFNDTGCASGLENSFVMLELVAANRWIIYAGNFAATISSALACLVGAPRVFQALCRDKIYPGIEIFGKGYGNNDEPVRSYGITFVTALAVILIGNLNAIAAIMSNFFMAAFCLINFACFHAAVAKSPGFRPSFHWWNKWVSCLGAIICLIVMFVMSWITAIITITICLMLYLYLYYKQPKVNWGSSAQAEAYRKALKSLQHLNEVHEHVKNYRPQLLVMTGKLCWRPSLVDFAYQISKGIGAMVCGHIVQTPISYAHRTDLCKLNNSWLLRRKCKAFYSMVANEDFESGAVNLLQLSGMGKVRPNMFVLGYKSNWTSCDAKEAISYVNIIHDAFDMHMGVGILRMPSGLDFSFFTDTDELNTGKLPPIITNCSVDSGLDFISSVETIKTNENEIKPKKQSKKEQRKRSLVRETPKEVLDQIDYFRIVQRGTIDVWWLYDDGGLTILIPDILTKRKEWNKCELRVFALANRNNQMVEEQRNLASMLGKFRIECEHVHIISDISKPAKAETKNQYMNMASKFIKNEQDEMSITDENLIENEEKINRLLRIREEILEHSKDANLIIISLPMPHRNRTSTALYLSWLEILTQGMPPTFLIRGNQTNPFMRSLTS
uniref:Uncharacterized protein n=1 Tax=Strigamia maritima TaxID=126957 RepID=T1IHE8_STRMM